MAKQKKLTQEDKIECDSYLSKSLEKRMKAEQAYDTQKLNYRVDVSYKNAHQAEFATLIRTKDIVICKGMAGSGKTFIALAQSLKLLQSSDSNIRKIYLLMPTVESGNNSLGFLPGTWEEKIAPYLDSFYYLIDKLVGKEKRKSLVESKFIEPLAIQYLRGKNIDNAVLIFDEAQNCDIVEAKTILTRIGTNTKIIFAGDIDQIDNKHLNGRPSLSGLSQSFARLGDLEEVGLIEFDENDVVRNPIISKILSRFPKPKTLEDEEAEKAERFVARKAAELEKPKEIEKTHCEEVTFVAPPPPGPIKKKPWYIFVE